MNSQNREYMEDIRQTFLRTSKASGARGWGHLSGWMTKKQQRTMINHVHSFINIKRGGWRDVKECEVGYSPLTTVEGMTFQHTEGIVGKVLT
jgi:hypothetical protein